MLKSLRDNLEALRKVVKVQQNEKVVFCYKYKMLHQQYMELKHKEEAKMTETGS
jgi:hypothetical protein